VRICEADVWGPRVGEGQSDRAGGGGGLCDPGLGTKNREPRTEPKEPGTGTERTGTEKIGSCSVPDSLEPKFPGSSVRFLG
jgi:hypothetical protein